MWFYCSAVECCWVVVLFYHTLHASGITMGSKMRTVLECIYIVPLSNVRLERPIVSLALRYGLDDHHIFTGVSQ